MNIEVEYRYRDWGNFKKYGAVVFRNKQNLTYDEVRRRALRLSADEQFIDAARLRIPELFFTDCPFDPDLDHGMHEYCGACETESSSNDSAGRDISDFLIEMESLAVSQY